MSNTTPQETFVKDYKVPPFLVQKTDLSFNLNEDVTEVSSTLAFVRHEKCTETNPVLVLNGVDLELVSLQIDDTILTEADYTIEGEDLTIADMAKFGDDFILRTQVRIKPQENTSLEGLYKSNAMYCSQCEAEGFRKITYYTDRPDQMSVFTVSIEGDKSKYPVMLSNGNKISYEELGTRHKVTWNDPFKKPAHLFALVAGDLEVHKDTFTTMTGREIDLQIFTEAENIEEVPYAMGALKRSMKWDEDVYGREYDLDIFMIVAVNDFNMGAMENKGLNVFNTSCVLASPKTATDARFQRVEGVVGHEYFHNWTGNRVNCRDWFQLTLKEGLTVFRDQEFSSDLNSRTVQRVEDVNALRSHQFAEDAGPSAHPIQPKSFITINNFYTSTVYKKGAEVIRMMHTLLGKEKYRKATDLYFERHDGQAVTTEEFVKAMEDGGNIDLTQFRLWYDQASTPEVKVRTAQDADAGTYTLHFAQSCPSDPKMKAEDKKPFHIPVRLGLLDEKGADITLQTDDDAFDSSNNVFSFTGREQSITFTGVTGDIMPSLFRGYSAPVKVDYPYTRDALMFLMQHDADGFNRWEASQKLAIDIIQELIATGGEGDVDERLIQAYKHVLADKTLDKAMVAKMMVLPNEAYLSTLYKVIDVDEIHNARELVRKEVAIKLHDDLLDVYSDNLSDAEYAPAANQIAERSLKNVCLAYLADLNTEETLELARKQLRLASNMTDEYAALMALAHSEASDRDAHLADFYAKWKHRPLVVDSWFVAQSTDSHERTLSRVKALMNHEAFAITNPNKVRSLIGAFSANQVQFHRKDGEGYAFLADQVIALDKLNPQTAAHMITPLTKWKQYDEARQGLMRAQLERISKEDLSPDILEKVTQAL